MEILFSLFQRIKHFFKAKGANGIHSPFVFELYNEVLNHPYNFYAFSEIEDQRDLLLESKNMIEYQDIGTRKKHIKTKISTLASKSLMPWDKDVFLFQLCHWMKPNLVVELGTSLGITTSYISKAYPATIYTFEGIKAIADEAIQVWQKLKNQNIQLILGPIENTLPDFLSKNNPKIDIAIVDANHSYEATMLNFNTLLENMNETGCIVFDDIYWSKDMAKAWNEIIKRPEITVSIDLFHLGLVFFRKSSLKENFCIHW